MMNFEITLSEGEKDFPIIEYKDEVIQFEYKTEL